MVDLHRVLTNHWKGPDGRSGSDLFPLSPEDRPFSGLVETDDVTVYVVDGYALDVRGGSLTDVLDERLDVYHASNPAEPYLLAVHGNGSERATLYTEDKSLDEAVRELEDASFTGYVELSERVVTGDYYAVFHRGSADFLGVTTESNPPLAGPDAREEMLEQVGLYSVNRAWIDPVDLGTDPTSWHEPRVADERIERAQAFDSGMHAGDTRVFDRTSDGRPSPSEPTADGPDPRTCESGGTEIYDADARTGTDSGNGRGTVPDVCPGCGTNLERLQIDTLSFCPECGSAVDDH